MTRACQGAEIEFPSGRKPLPGKRQQVLKSLRIISKEGRGQDGKQAGTFTISSGRRDRAGLSSLRTSEPVLLALQQQGVLNETQFKDCVQKLEKYTRMNGGNE